MSNRLAKVLGITLVVPAIGIGVFSLILSNLDGEAVANGIDSLSYVCAHAGEYSGEEEICSARAPLALLQQLAFLGAAIPLVIVGLQLVLAGVAGRKRQAMATVFPLLTRITIVGLIAMVLVQTAVAIGSLWFGESELFGSVHVGVMLTLGLGALVASWSLLSAIGRMSVRPKLGAVGKLLTPETAPRLFAHVRALAERLGSPAPRNIVLGMQPNFYVTHADVNLYNTDKPLKGETLYLSAPMARLMTVPELDAVIGHELGHFRGEDTRYSLKFAPVYAGIGTAVDGMLDSDDRLHLMALPAVQMLGLLHETFAGAEAHVSRERELEADRAGAEASSGEALSLALLKLSLHAEAWEALMQQPKLAYALNEGGDYSKSFVRRVGEAFSEERWRADVENVLGDRIVHPIDTHPPVGERLEALGFDVAGLDLGRLMPPASGSGAELIDGIDALETEVSQIEFDFRDRIGALPPSVQAGLPPLD